MFDSKGNSNQLGKIYDYIASLSDVEAIHPFLLAKRSVDQLISWSVDQF